MSTLSQGIPRTCWILGSVVVMLLLRATAAQGDEIELRDGSRLRGVVVRQTKDTVTIGKRTLPTSDVLAIAIEGKRRVLKRTGTVDRRQTYMDAKTFTGLASDAYMRKFTEFASKGYRPMDIRGDAAGGEPRYDVTMAKGPRWKWFATHNCEHAKFIQKNERAEEEGYSLVVHSQFRVGGKAMHAAVWVLPPVAFHGAGELPETGASTPALAPIDKVARSFVLEQNIPGLAIAVAKDGQLVYARGFGYADVERKEPVLPESLFRIASVSKPITAVAVMQLIERGKLSFDTRMVDVLRTLVPRGQKGDPRLNVITVRHLLQHTAGWDLSLSPDPVSRTVQIAKELHVPAPAAPDDIIRYMLGRSLDFSPGERYAYSNLGYCVLGRIIEQVSGHSYEDYVRQSVLAPLGIEHMSIAKTRLADRADGEVRYYTRYEDTGPSVFEADGVVPVQYGGWSLEAMDANGGWIASATDLVRFASAQYDSAKTRILSRESVREMFAPPAVPIGRTVDGKLKPAYYACGWTVQRIQGGKVNHQHNGRFAGTSTLLVCKHDGFCWAVLCNINTSIDGGEPAELIGAPLRRAICGVHDWPSGTGSSTRR